jgi:hypothetical protein
MIRSSSRHSLQYSKACKLLAAAVLYSLVTGARAAHPLVTDDAGTQGKGNSQIEINTDWLKEGSAQSRSGALTYSYGLQENLDVFINLPASLSSPRGINDASLGGKWRFVEKGASSLAVKPELLLATGDVSKGLGNGRTGMALTMIGSYEVAPWAYHVNLGVTLNRYQLQSAREANRRAIWRISMAVVYSLSEQWKLVGDAGVEQDSDKSQNERPAFLLGGVIYSPNRDVDLDVGIKTTFRCSQCQGGQSHQFGGGLTWRF